MIFHSIKYSEKKSGWKREESSFEQDSLAQQLTDAWFQLSGKLPGVQGSTAPLSNPEDLPDQLKGLVISFQIRPTRSEAACFQDIKANSELWEKAVEIADKIPFNKWVVYSSQLTPDVFIFWSNVLRHTRPQVAKDSAEEPDAQNIL